MTMPELRQFGDLSPADFDRHPVWVNCHGADDGEPWYEETDEETFRPWTGALPVSQADGMFLVRAQLELRDGGRFRGFITPPSLKRILEYYSHICSSAGVASGFGVECSV